MTGIVAFGSLVILILFGITDGFVGSMTTAQVAENQGSFQVRTAAYADDPVPENALSPGQLTVALEALAGVRVRGSRRASKWGRCCEAPTEPTGSSCGALTRAPSDR